MDVLEPQRYYRDALAKAQDEESRLKRSDRLYVAVKLALFLLLVVLSATVVRFAPHDAWMLVVVLAVLVAAFVLHERTLKRLARCEQRIRYYQQGVARMEDRWAGSGQSGKEFLHDEHLYARDLDVFGAGGLYELISIAKTSAGRETLAAWLMAPVRVNYILERQEAVKELAPRYAFREQMALAGDEMEAGIRSDQLVAWCEGEPAVAKWFAFLVAPVLGAAWVLGIVLAVMSVAHSVEFLVGTSVLNYSLMVFYGKRLFGDADAAESAAEELPLLLAVMERMEQEVFSAPMLQKLQAGLTTDGARASQALKRLNRGIQWLESRHNMFVRVLDAFMFWTPVCLGFLDVWRSRHGKRVDAWLMAEGDMEALHALACYAWEHPDNAYPEFVTAGPLFAAEGLRHPLLPAKKAVTNDVRLDREQQLIMLSGPNMAGKSTLLRAIGLNAVLAQAGAPVCATSLRMSELLVAASICVLDSLQGGLSRFYSEIQRLKQMQDLAEHGPRVLFLLDELLSGTNSKDRRTGTEAVVRTLLKHGAVGIVTTHDLALTEIVGRLDGKAANYHFEDHYIDGELVFDYRLVPGVAQTTNALKLMRAVGLDVEAG
ncbi:MAG: MutS-related protein [Acidobacteriaceae bacterium]